MKKILHICMLSLLPMGYAWGDVVSNFANEKNTSCKPFVVSDSTLFAGSFTTASTGSYQLNEVFLSIVSVSLDASASTPGGSFRVQLWSSDVAGNPNSVLDILSGPAKTPAFGDNLKPAVLSYSAHVGTLLNPNTKYWISASIVGGNDLLVGLERSQSKAEVSNPPGWTIGDQELIVEGGTPTLDDSCVPFLKVTATLVPEPSSVAMLGLTGAGLLLLARRRK